MRFADTNVLLYAISVDPAERRKAEVANEVLADPQISLSTQVLQEFYAQTTHPARADALSHERAASLVATFLQFPIQETTAALVLAAIMARERWQISYWDAAIIEAARAGGCEVVLTEDLNDGQDFDGVRVHNPFA